MSKRETARMRPVRLGWALVLAVVVLCPSRGWGQTTISLGDLPAGRSVTFTFDVQLNPTLAPGTTALTQGGTLSGDNFPAVETTATIAVGTGGVGGIVLGDMSPSKLIPYYRAQGSVATILGLESSGTPPGGQPGVPAPLGVSTGVDVLVHVVVFDVRSVHVLDFSLCLSPFDFGFVVFQESAPSAGQLAEVRQQGQKVGVVTVAEDHIPGEGYVTVKAIQAFTSRDGSCREGASALTPYGPGAAGPLAGWAILQDVSTSFFGTGLPVVTALVDSVTGVASGGLGAYGLMPAGNQVVVRYDVNPAFGLETELFVWLASNARDVNGELVRAERVPGVLQCEHELEISTQLLLPDEMNVLNPAQLGGIGQCIQVGEYRGVVRLALPAAGIVWTHVHQVSQEDQHFREQFLGHQLGCNAFVSEICP